MKTIKTLTLLGLCLLTPHFSSAADKCAVALEAPEAIHLREQIEYAINNVPEANRRLAMDALIESSLRELANQKGRALSEDEKRNLVTAITSEYIKTIRGQSQRGGKALSIVLTNISDNKELSEEDLQRLAESTGQLPAAAAEKYITDKNLLEEHLKNLSVIGIEFDSSLLKDDSSVLEGFKFDNYNLGSIKEDQKKYDAVKNSLSYIFPEAYAMAILSESREEVLQLGAYALLPPANRGEGLSVTVMDIELYEKRVKDTINSFHNSLKKSMEDMKEATGYFSGIKGLLRGSGRTQHDESSASANSHMDSANRDIRYLKNLGVNNKIISVLQDLKTESIKQQGRQIDAFINKITKVQIAYGVSFAVPAVLYVGTYLGGTAVMSSLAGGTSTAVVGTTNGLAIATSKMALLGLAFGVASPTINAGIDTWKKGGSFTCHLANEWYEKGGATSTLNSAAILASIPPAIALMTISGSAIGFSAPVLYIGGNVTVGTLFALEMARTAGKEFYQCYKTAMKTSKIEDGPNKEQLVNHYSAEAWKLCTNAVVSMGFAVVGARSVFGHARKAGQTMRENFNRRHGRDPNGRDIWNMIYSRKMAGGNKFTITDPIITEKAIERFKQENDGKTPSELPQSVISMAEHRMEVLKQDILIEMNRSKVTSEVVERNLMNSAGTTIKDGKIRQVIDRFISNQEKGLRDYHAGESQAAARETILDLVSRLEGNNIELRILNENGKIFKGEITTRPEFVQIKVEGEWQTIATRETVKIPTSMGQFQEHVVIRVRLADGSIRIIDPSIEASLYDALGKSSPMYHGESKTVFTQKQHRALLEKSADRKPDRKQTDLEDGVIHFKFK